jgi:hypothetical protein
MKQTINKEAMKKERNIQRGKRQKRHKAREETER